MEITSISSTLDKIEGTKKHCNISKFRNNASQIYAAFATNIVKCTSGSTVGFTSVLVAELYKENAEIEMSVNDLTWFSSKFFLVPVGSLLLGLLAQHIGSRRTMLISSVFYIVSFLTFYFATSSGMLLIAQAIGGLLYTTSVGPGITYVVEITQPTLRSALTASTSLAIMCAAFLVVLLSNFLHWRTIALVILVFPITGFMAVFTIPESPHWLASKNKFHEAEAALCWLRGWCSPENVATEFADLKGTYRKSSHFMDHTSTTKGNAINSSKLIILKDRIRPYAQRSFYIPLLSTCGLCMLHSFTGASPLMIYSIVIFNNIKAPIDAHVAASIFDAMRILGALICIFSISYTGKKILVYISLAGAALTLSTASVAVFLKDYQIYPEVCQWIAAIAMIFTTFLTSAGIDKVIGILNAEIFPTKYRNVGKAVGLLTLFIGQAISNKLFLSLMEAITLPGVFIFFAAGCIITCTFFHFMFPETEGRTLQEIEDHFSGIKKL